MRRLIATIAVLALSACATPEPPTARLTPPSAAVGPGATRLAAAADREWRAWGSIAVNGWPVALERTPDATPELFDRLMTYWSATRDGPGIAARHRMFRDTLQAPSSETVSLDPSSGLAWNVIPAVVGISTYNEPAWSAAFVSHVMLAAGADFQPSSSHALYLDPILARFEMDPAGAPFRPHAPAEYAPRRGDVVCWDRSAVPLTHWRDRLAEPGRSRPMHCDVVVRNGGGTADFVGGNVLDVVLRRRVTTDAAGRLDTPPLDRPPFLLVLENRR